MNDPGEQQEFRVLMARALDGALDRGAMLRLVQMCRNDPSLAREFGSQMEVDRLLEIALSEVAAIPFSGVVMERIANSGEEAGQPFVSSVMGEVGRISGRRKRWVFAAAGIAAMGILWLGVSLGGLLPVAQLHRDDTAKWSAEPPAESLRAGSRLRLESGLAEVHFGNGAELILEGPADLEIQGKSAGFLHRGRVSVRVPERAIGFALDSPGGRVVDLGTAFGVHVDEGGDTQTEVFEGKVRVRASGDGKQVFLAQNEKFTSDRSGWQKTMGINANAFVTNLPPQPQGGLPYVHWSMDERQGSSTKAVGALADQRPAELRNLNPANGALPEWVRGPYGSALSFNGQGQALETFCPGPVGDAARTVAFWLRLPADFDPEQGYGIISWGDLAEEGNAWQISVNPYTHEGPVGRLRVGIFPSLVTGSSDLRDGRWHHCAVVLYKDERDDRRIPILLYVDGRMEATAAKGIFSAIHTSDRESSRSVWVAKSLRHEDLTRSRGTGFFRGDLDEIYIFDGALNQVQI
jgi:hypothetical protein